MSDLPSVSVEPYWIVLDHYGVLECNPFLELGEALAVVRELLRSGHKVNGINRGDKRFLEGAGLRAILGNETQKEFFNFPR